MKKILLIPSILTIGLAPMVSMVGCGERTEPTKIYISKTSLDLMVGDTAKLTAVVEPEEASQEVEWSTSNPAVCKVNDGEVEAIGEGTAKITVKPKGYDISAVCIVNVTTEPPKDYIMINNYMSTSNSDMLMSAHLSEPVAAPDTLFYFKIDMAKWDGSFDGSYYTNFYFELDSQIDHDFLSKTDLEIKLDGVPLDNSKVSIHHTTSAGRDNECLVFEDSCSQSLLNATIISGQVRTGSSHVTTYDYYFFFYGERVQQ